VATPPIASPDTGPRTPQEELRDSAEFQQLRRIFRSFIFPMTALFLVWYFMYVLLAAFAPDFMGTKVIGNINVGLLFGLGQFVSTFAITILYKNWADQKFDPAANAIRERLEAGAR
jgi:uncharacterized membrane protein (DUF485 family)